MHMDVTRAKFEDGSVDARKLITDNLAAVVTAVQTATPGLAGLSSKLGSPSRWSSDHR
jgi:hypothetical protein